MITVLLVLRATNSIRGKFSVKVLVYEQTDIFDKIIFTSQR